MTEGLKRGIKINFLLVLLVLSIISLCNRSLCGNDYHVILVVWVDDIHCPGSSLVRRALKNLTAMQLVSISTIKLFIHKAEDYNKYLGLTDVLIIINPVKNYTETEANYILRWVKEEGGLLVIIIDANYLKTILEILHKINISIVNIQNNYIFFSNISSFPYIESSNYNVGYVNYGKGKIILFGSIKCFLKYCENIFKWLLSFVKYEKYTSIIKIKLIDSKGKPLPDITMLVSSKGKTMQLISDDHGEAIIYFKGYLCIIEIFKRPETMIYFPYIYLYIKPRLKQINLTIKVNILPRVEITVWGTSKPEVTAPNSTVKIFRYKGAYRVSIIFSTDFLYKKANISISVLGKKYVYTPVLNRNIIFYSIGEYPGEKIYVKVVDEQQKPICGAVVFSTNFYSIGPLFREVIFSLTNSSGIACVPREGKYIVAFKDFKNTTFIDLLSAEYIESYKSKYKILVLKRVGHIFSWLESPYVVDPKTLREVEPIWLNMYAVGVYYIRVGDFILTNCGKGYVVKMGKGIVFEEKYEFYKNLIYLKQLEIAEYKSLLNKGFYEGIVLSEVNVTLDKCSHLLSKLYEYLLFRDYNELSFKYNVILNDLNSVKYILMLYIESLPVTNVIVTIIIMIFCLIVSGFILSSKNHALRTIVSISCFTAIMFLLHLTHPGFKTQVLPKVSFQEFLIISLSLALIVSILLFKISSRLEGRLAVLAFEVSLRNIRRRRFRSTLFLFSVAAMVFSLVLFSSISVVVFNFRSLVGFDTNAVSTGVVLHLRYLKDYEKIVVFKAVEFVARNYTVVYRVMSLKPSAYCYIDRVRDWEGYLCLLCRGSRCVKVRGVLGIVPSLEEKLTILPKIVVKGRFLRDNDTYGVLVSLSYAKRLGLKVGDVIKFKGYELKVVGIFDERLYAQVKDLDGMILRPWNKFSCGTITVDSRATSPEGVLIVHENFAKKLDVCYIDKVIIVTKSAEEALEVASRLLPVLPPRVVPFVCLGGEAYIISRSYSFNIKGAETLILLAIGSLIVINLMLAEVYDRSREIEIYTAIGMNPLQVALIFLTQSIILAFSGGGLGYIASVLTVLILKTVYSSYSVNIIPVWSVTALTTVIAVCLASTTIPARRASLKVVPSFMRKWKLKFKKGVYEETLPFKIPVSKANIIISSICSKIKSKYSYYGLTRIEEEKISEEKTTDSVVKKISYKISFTSGVLFAQVVQVDFIFEKKLDRDYYTLKLKVKSLAKTYKYKEELYHLIDDIRKTCLEICSGSLK